ncbi:transmembrane protein 89 [Ochotona princeps]|uniref:transmembrane protein 89 n=1 Tax=Ochotona princeps TaxID=9978 RepID=UPI0027144B09|nr:transmembrane protein 89 [Ochotona princeps]
MPLVLSFLPSLLLLMLPASSHAWTRPLWYQVGLDLQPWGCQQNNLDACERSISCPGYWMSLGGKNMYPVAGVTLTTTMMLMFSRAMLQRWRSQGAKGEDPQVTVGPCKAWKQKPVVSERALLHGVLHMLDALLLHIEGHLQRLATQKQIQIKEPPTQLG